MEAASLILTVLAGSGTPGTLTVLFDGVSTTHPGFVLLPDGDVLFVDGEGLLRRLDPADPASAVAMETDWDPARWGWESCTGFGLLRISPDGRWLCLGEQVAVPESLQTADGYVPGPVVLVLMGSDGTGARPLALSFDVGGGPRFDFTRDSRFVYGMPLLECGPTPEAFVTHWALGGEDPAYAGYLVDVRDGTRSGEDRGFLGDGYHPNPWSDLVAAGCYPPDVIADVTTGEVLLRDSSESPWGIVETWVLPDAGLAWLDGVQVLRHADGRTVANPGEPLFVCGRLQDGRYVFGTDGGATILLGDVDWETFGTLGAVPLHGLEGTLDPWSEIVGLPDGSGILFEQGGALLLYAFPVD